jgi:thioredoxin reductase
VQVEVLDRDRQPGGVPRLCHHMGFGLRDLRRPLTGPAYAARRVDRAVGAGAEVRTGVCVTGWSGPLELETTSPDGLERVRAGAVVLATGARERPRPARWIAGDRPDGVLTTGLLQRLVYERGLPVGRTAVVVGAEHVSFSAVVTLHHAGVEVVAMVTAMGHHQSYAAFRAAAAARFRFPLLTGTVVTRVVGHRRVEGVEVRGPDGRRRLLGCDTVVLTGDWVADHELARTAGVEVDRASTAPVVDTALRTGVEGLVCAGNLVHPVLVADLAAADGEVAADRALAALRGGGAVPGSVGFALGEGLAWVAPGRVPADLAVPPRGSFVLWAREPLGRPQLEVRQGGRLLWRGRARLPLSPGRPYDLPARWVPGVRVPGPPLSVTAH